MFDLSNAKVKHPVSELSATVSVKSKLIPNDDPTIIPHMLHESWLSPVAAILSITTDQTVLDAIKCGYASDDYCIKISNSSMSGTKCVNGLWYIRDRLVIPHIGDICENLFRLAHDCLGHFSVGGVPDAV